MSTPQIVTSIAEAQKVTRSAISTGKRVGLVPTMGALHDGHLSLVDASRQACDVHVVSIFVNPTQFGEGEDLDKYPRTFNDDLEKLARRDVDFVFAPAASEMYPDGYSTFVQPPAVANSLEGRYRTAHFRGVATVVLKLFNAVPASMAFFGEKDFQQCLVVQHMASELNVPIEVIACPIVREPDGLALSSRNRYLSEAERFRALSLSQSLSLVEQEFNAGKRQAVELERMMADRLRADVDSVDYAVVVNARTLSPFQSEIDDPAVALIAARVGATRLIDNRRLG